MNKSFYTYISKRTISIRIRNSNDDMSWSVGRSEMTPHVEKIVPVNNF